MLRTLPSSLSLAMVIQPSSISSSGVGQWIWNRSRTSSLSRRRLASHSGRIDSALRLWPIFRCSSQTMLHLVKTYGRLQRKIGVPESIDGGRIDPVDAVVQRFLDRGYGVVVVLGAPGELPARAADGPGAE